MYKIDLNSISKASKAAFLTKLKSGRYTMGIVYPPQKPATFDLQPNGLYRNNETGEELTRDAIAELPGYRFNLEVIQDLKMAPTGFVLVPFSEEEYLDSLLISKDNKASSNN